ncbi:hypothetical protein NC651_011709 [Populus alba x Populus x berolinensis]|nr:hypothetical protein NC651_011709 [Populus alba x Populus x berolinensis]
MLINVSRFSFYNLRPHAYFHFFRCGILKAWKHNMSTRQQQSPAS